MAREPSEKSDESALPRGVINECSESWRTSSKLMKCDYLSL